ncbi:MAG: universal stress protein [Alphaproteobacteria bacterium]|nr:universal stress protein [Alphaproteobacteria bacterium]
MTYRKILVPLVGRPRDATALSAAFDIAKRFNAHVAAFVVMPDPAEALPFMGEGLSGAVVQEIIEASKSAGQKTIAAAQETLKQIAGKAGVPIVDHPGAREVATAALRVTTGNFADAVEAESRLSDLCVFGEMASGDDFALREALETALVESGRPVFVTPKGGLQAFGERVAIGYDGGAAAAHAVHAALPFLARAKQIDLFVISGSQKALRKLEPLRDYLSLRGLTSTEHVVDPAGKGVGAALLEAASRAKADLLVIGGYGHSRLQEFVLGGVTRHILAEAAPMPVVMAH